MGPRTSLRTRQRGAVMVEAVVVIVFFVMCFSAVVYFRLLYTQKMSVQRLARAASISHAMGACQGDSKAPVASDLGTRKFEEKEPKNLAFDVLPSGLSGLGIDALDKALALEGATGKVTTIAVDGEASSLPKRDPNAPPPDPKAPKPLGFEGHVSSDAVVACADVTPDDRYAALAELIARTF